MTLTLTALPRNDSLIGRLDPRWKLAALVVGAGVVALLQTLPASAVALSGAVGLVLVGRLPPRWYLSRLAPVLVFVGAVALTLPFLVREPGPLLWLGPVGLSGSGIRLALLFACKGLAIVSLMLVLVATAPLETTFRAAHALRVPGLFIQLGVLTYRYLFVLAGELAQLRVALRVRGYRNRMSRHCYRTVGHVAGTLLVRSYERAERVGQAMRTRGFDGRFRSLGTFRTKPADVAAFLVVAGGAAGLLAWDLFRRG